MRRVHNFFSRWRQKTRGMLSDFSYLDLLAVVRVHLAIHRLIKYLPLWLGHRIVDSSAERYVQIDARITASLPQLSGLGALSIAL